MSATGTVTENAARRRRAARTRRTVSPARTRRGCPPRAGSPPRTRSGTEARAPVRGCSHVLPWAWPEALRGVGVARMPFACSSGCPLDASGPYACIQHTQRVSKIITKMFDPARFRSGHTTPTQSWQESMKWSAYTTAFIRMLALRRRPDPSSTSGRDAPIASRMAMGGWVGSLDRSLRGTAGLDFGI